MTPITAKSASLLCRRRSALHELGVLGVPGLGLDLTLTMEIDACDRAGDIEVDIPVTAAEATTTIANTFDRSALTDSGQLRG